MANNSIYNFIYRFTHGREIQPKTSFILILYDE